MSIKSKALYLYEWIECFIFTNSKLTTFINLVFCDLVRLIGSKNSNNNKLNIPKSLTLNIRLFFLVLTIISFYNTLSAINITTSISTYALVDNNIKSNPLSTFTLTEFGSRKINEESFQLFWQIPNNTNFSHFEIEESNGSDDFEVIEKISYTDNTNKYDSKTVALATHAKFYRLKIVNHDGSFDYSDLVFVDKLVKKPFTLAPHSTSSDFIIIETKSTEQFDINIFTTSGELIYSKKLSGLYSYEVGLPVAHKETLVFEMTSGESVSTEKLIRM